MSNQVNTKEQVTVAPLQRKMILTESSPFVLQEAYKTLRTNLLFSLRGDGCKRFCITSSLPGEGKSITILNLAISIAQTGKRVLLIDADLRRPALARLMADNPAPGLSNVLAGQVSTLEAIRMHAYTNLDVLFSGDVPPNPSELLGSENMRNLINEMSNRYDFILVDTPPINLVSDAGVVTDLLDGVLILVRQGRARKDAVKRAIANLELIGIKPLGFIFNGVEISSGKAYNYSYYE